MAKPKLIAVGGTPELHARLERARRLPVFDKIPSMSALVRRFIEEGLARMEQAPAPQESHP